MKEHKTVIATIIAIWQRLCRSIGFEFENNITLSKPEYARGRPRDKTQEIYETDIQSDQNGTSYGRNSFILFALEVNGRLKATQGGITLTFAPNQYLNSNLPETLE